MPKWTLDMDLGGWHKKEENSILIQQAKSDNYLKLCINNVWMGASIYLIYISIENNIMILKKYA